MSWTERALPWLSSHAISLFIIVCLIVLADMLYARAYHRQTNLVGLSRRLAQLHRPRPQLPQSEDN